MSDFSEGGYGGRDKYLFGKMTRTIAGDAGRYLEEDALQSLYPDEKLGPAYRKWHYIVLTSFYPDEEQENAIKLLLLAYHRKIEIDTWKTWLLYFGIHSTSISRHISGMTNITKIAFLKQKRAEVPGGDFEETFFG